MKDAFLQAMSRAANSVCVVTTDGAAGRAGVTVSAMTTVSVDMPNPSLLVCIHNLSPACDAIQRNRVFCANLLSSDQVSVSDSFAGRTGAKGAQKFEGASWKHVETGAPILEGALATFDCRVMHDVLVGSHRIFVGEAMAVESGEEGLPLLYFDRAYAEPGALTDVASSPPAAT